MSDLTNGRFRVPVPMLYIDDDVPVRERRPNRPKRERKMPARPRFWR